MAIRKKTNSPAVELETRVEAYLLSLHCTLWQQWDITDPKERKNAVAWMVDTMRKIETF